MQLAKGAVMMADIDRIREAVSFVPPDDRDTWLKMGMAIKSEIGDSGFDVWDVWSRQADNYDASDARNVWKSIRADGKVTVRTLYHEAKANGWRNDGSFHKPPPAELAERRRKAEERAAQEEADVAREREETAKKATAIWNVATPADDNHPYLVHKRIKAHGARLHKGALVIPVRSGSELQSLQFIS
jgi:putative DNA primase/helicase